MQGPQPHQAPRDNSPPVTCIAPFWRCENPPAGRGRSQVSPSFISPCTEPKNAAASRPVAFSSGIQSPAASVTFFVWGGSSGSPWPATLREVTHPWHRDFHLTAKKQTNCKPHFYCFLLLNLVWRLFYKSLRDSEVSVQTVGRLSKGHGTQLISGVSS